MREKRTAKPHCQSEKYLRFGLLSAHSIASRKCACFRGVLICSAKVEVGPLVDLPCFTQPPPKSCWIATPHWQISSKRSRKEGRCEVV